MGNLKAFWNYLDGKKSVIAAVAGVAIDWAQYKNLIDGMTALYIALGLTAFTGVAVGHKIAKSKNEQA
jgi:hypothetical protein